MTTARKFFRTEFKVEVLSEEPYGLDGVELADVAYDITEGHFNGNVWTVVENEEIDGARAATLLIESGSDPGFFGLTAEGDDDKEYSEEDDLP